jgi:hypothetical protein
MDHDVLTWFEDGERGVCPLCAEKSVLPVGRAGGVRGR